MFMMLLVQIYFGFVYQQNLQEMRSPSRHTLQFNYEMIHLLRLDTFEAAYFPLLGTSMLERLSIAERADFCEWFP